MPQWSWLRMTKRLKCGLDKDTYTPLKNARSTVMNKMQNEACQALYALKKQRSIGLLVHKQDVSFRMIVDFTSSLNFNLARYLSQII